MGDEANKDPYAEFDATDAGADPYAEFDAATRKVSQLQKDVDDPYSWVYDSPGKGEVLGRTRSQGLHSGAAEPQLPHSEAADVAAAGIAGILRGVGGAGLADEVAGVTGALSHTPGTSYEGRRDAYRAMEDDLESRHPYVMMAGDVAATAATLPAKVGFMAATGLGALAGFGRSEGSGTQLAKDTAQGGLLGFAFKAGEQALAFGGKQASKIVADFKGSGKLNYLRQQGFSPKMTGKLAKRIAAGQNEDEAMYAIYREEFKGMASREIAQAAPKQTAEISNKISSNLKGLAEQGVRLDGKPLVKAMSHVQAKFSKGSFAADEQIAPIIKHLQEESVQLAAKNGDPEVYIDIMAQMKRAAAESTDPVVSRAFVEAGEIAEKGFIDATGESGQEVLDLINKRHRIGQAGRAAQNKMTSLGGQKLRHKAETALETMWSETKAALPESDLAVGLAKFGDFSSEVTAKVGQTLQDLAERSGIGSKLAKDILEAVQSKSTSDSAKLLLIKALRKGPEAAILQYRVYKKNNVQESPYRYY